MSSLLPKADIGMTATRGTTGFLDSSLGKDIGSLTNRVLDQRADVRGQITVHSRSAITADWRLQPNLTSQLALGDSAVQLAGIKLNMTSEARPLLERMVSQQISALETRLRSDPFIERAARAQWAKKCRAIPLGGGKTGLPQLWLEMRPVRAAAAQPRIEPRDVVLTVGVQAETRITPSKTKPQCVVAQHEVFTIELGAPVDERLDAEEDEIAAEVVAVEHVLGAGCFQRRNRAGRRHRRARLVMGGEGETDARERKHQHERPQRQPLNLAMRAVAASELRRQRRRDEQRRQQSEHLGIAAVREAHIDEAEQHQQADRRQGQSAVERKADAGQQAEREAG